MTSVRLWIGIGLISLGAVALIVGGGGLLAGRAFAGGLWGGPWAGGPWHAGGGFQLPPELAELRDLPAGERFTHFRGVQVTLTDRDNHPYTLTVTPGTATAVSATSLTLAANDGTTRTFTVDAQTMIHAQSSRGANATAPAIAQNDQVVVVTRDNGPVARAVIAIGPNGPGFGPFSH